MRRTWMHALLVSLRASKHKSKPGNGLLYHVRSVPINYHSTISNAWQRTRHSKGTRALLQQAWISFLTWTRYDRLVMMQALDTDPNFHICLNPACSSGQLQEDPMCQVMSCHSCNFMTCTNHHLPWHNGETCEEYDLHQALRTRNLADEAASEAFLATTRVIKRCPGKSCGVRLEKNEGCDHFTCMFPVPLNLYLDANFIQVRYVTASFVGSAWPLILE